MNLARYWYNGVGHVVGTDLPEADVWSRQFSGSTFPDFDNFNRVTTSMWEKDLATDRAFYDVDITYDRNSNITLVEDNIHTGFDVEYTIDGLNRLTSAQEGTWGGASIGTETRHQTFTLDQVGNWADQIFDHNDDGDGQDANEVEEQRTHNTVNELTDRDIENDGDAMFDDVLYDLVYDANGNLTDDDENYDYVYDAWNRLIEIGVTNSANVVAKFEYNGLNHRTLAHHDTDTDGDVDANDTKVWFAYNERWQLMATFEDTDATPTEEWVYHAAGANGRGGASYIDESIKRWWDSDGNGSLEDESYLCHNWRHDVSVVLTDTGKMREWVKTSAYGTPFGLPAGDTDSDGDWDSGDDSAIGGGGGWDARYDCDLDEDIDSDDITHASSTVAGYQTLGWTVLSSAGVANFKGYAGYEWDRAAPEMYHVRFRVLNTVLGRWNRRDPLGYVDGANLCGYAGSGPVGEWDSFGLCGSCQDPDEPRRPDFSECFAMPTRQECESCVDDIAQRLIDGCFDQYVRDEDACRKDRERQIADCKGKWMVARDKFVDCLNERYGFGWPSYAHSPDYADCIEEVRQCSGDPVECRNLSQNEYCSRAYLRAAESYCDCMNDARDGYWRCLAPFDDVLIGCVAEVEQASREAKLKCADLPRRGTERSFPLDQQNADGVGL